MLDSLNILHRNINLEKFLVLKSNSEGVPLELKLSDWLKRAPTISEKESKSELLTYEKGTLDYRSKEAL